MVEGVKSPHPSAIGNFRLTPESKAVIIRA